MGKTRYNLFVEVKPRIIFIKRVEPLISLIEMVKPRGSTTFHGRLIHGLSIHGWSIHGLKCLYPNVFGSKFLCPIFEPNVFTPKFLTLNLLWSPIIFLTPNLFHLNCSRQQKNWGSTKNLG